MAFFGLNRTLLGDNSTDDIDNMTSSTTAAISEGGTGHTGTASNPNWLISIATFQRIRYVLRLYVGIALGLFGFVVNILSIHILKRDGAWKSSNIILISLAIADMAYCLLKTDIWGLLYLFYNMSDRGFHFGYDANLFCFYGYVFTLFLSYVALFSSLTFPLLITVERLIAIFFPLKFAWIVTPKRTIIACLTVAICFVARCLPILFGYKYGIISERKMIVGATTLMAKNYMIVLQDITNWITGIGYLSFVAIGSIIIGIKVKLLSSQRKKIMATGDDTTSAKNSLRTTKTLLAVCVTYCIIVTAVYIMDSIRFNAKANSPFLALLWEIGNVLHMTNSSANFFIYILYNKKFRGYLPCVGKKIKSGGGKA